MKEKLRAGEPVFGVSVMIPSPQIVEMIGAAGFDWVLLDCEHGTLTLESVELMAMAAEACGITAIARPMTRSAEHILQMLDRGVMGVQVPHVNTAEDAREVIAAVKYHPAAPVGGQREDLFDERASARVMRPPRPHFAGITGNSTCDGWSGPVCTVTLPPYTLTGRLPRRSCLNGPTP